MSATAIHATLVQRAVSPQARSISMPGMGFGLPGLPAVIIIDDVEFTSAVPKFDGEAIHINEIARRLCEAK